MRLGAAAGGPSGRGIAADIALASLEGDTARCVRQFDRGLRIGDLFNHRWCLIESLVGMAIDTLIMGEMGRELAEREFTEADLEGILRAIDGDGGHRLDGDEEIVGFVVPKALLGHAKGDDGTDLLAGGLEEIVRPPVHPDDLEGMAADAHPLPERITCTQSAA